MFGFGSWKQLLAGRRVLQAGGEIGHHNGGHLDHESIGVGLRNDHGVVNSGAYAWLPKRGLLAPPRWGNNLQGKGVSQVRMGGEILCPKVEVELKAVW